MDKPAGQPCPHLTPDDRCGIHADLVVRGFPGCHAYDCFGAGQHLTRARRESGESSWRVDPAAAVRQCAAFEQLRRLHEMLVYLADASTRPVSAELLTRTDDLLGRLAQAARQAAAEPAIADIAGYRRMVGPLLDEVSRAVRAAHPAGAGAPGSGGRRRAAHRRVDWSGRDLRGTDLAGADVSGALLIGADLRGADLRCADLRGADLRAADLRGSDLLDALYLTTSQLRSAHTDDTTRLPTAPLVAVPDRHSGSVAESLGREPGGRALPSGRTDDDSDRRRRQ